MTLIIAGYNSKQSNDGLFFATDSHITQNNRVLIKGFKKVIEVPIKIKGMNFNGEWFNGYYGYRFESVCCIAFAGSSLVAQHLINAIKNHLTELHPTYYNGKYTIAMSCEKDKLLPQRYYDKSMFLDKHLNQILDAKIISDVVFHCISETIRQARANGSMRDLFSAYQAEFILGFQCPQEKQHHLYTYEIIPDPITEATVSVKKIDRDDIAVIGEKKFKSSALLALEGRDNNTQPSEAIFDYLNTVILNESSIGNNGIGKPTGLFKLEGSTLSRIKLEK